MTLRATSGRPWLEDEEKPGGGGGGGKGGEAWEGSRSRPGGKRQKTAFGKVTQSFPTTSSTRISTPHILFLRVKQHPMT